MSWHDVVYVLQMSWECGSVAIVCIAMLEIVLVGGAIYGWASMSLMLTREGVFADRCGTSPAPCAAQELRLRLVFAVRTVVPCWNSSSCSLS
jgi:hypothetical protein